MSNVKNYADEQALKVYCKDKPVGPGNLPQGVEHMHLKGIPAPKETAEYERDIRKSQARGYETDQEKFRIGRYEHLYTDKRN